MPIRHIVMWRVRGEGPAERQANAVQVRDAFASMQGCVPGMTRLELGIDESHVDYAFDVVLLSEFVDAEALAAYATHPAHEAAKRAAGDLRVQRYQVDHEILSTPHSSLP